jgi:prepilin-type N-terminal cleavage/methylation domain-containing protein
MDQVKRRMLRTEKGFSLIEVMIALVLFAVGSKVYPDVDGSRNRNTPYEASGRERGVG